MQRAEIDKTRKKSAYTRAENTYQSSVAAYNIVLENYRAHLNSSCYYCGDESICSVATNLENEVNTAKNTRNSDKTVRDTALKNYRNAVKEVNNANRQLRKFRRRLSNYEDEKETLLENTRLLLKEKRELEPKIEQGDRELEEADQYLLQLNRSIPYAERYKKAEDAGANMEHWIIINPAPPEFRKSLEGIQDSTSSPYAQ